MTMAGELTRRFRPSRAVTLLLVVTAILTVGLLLRSLPGEWSLTTETKRLTDQIESRPEVSTPQPSFDMQQWRLAEAQADPDRDPIGHSQQQRLEQLKVLFEHGAHLMQQGQYQQASRALEMVTQLSPRLPEGYVNLGFALYELQDTQAALEAFEYAAKLNPYQSNAYYGAALSYEQLGDLEAAMGNMRSFIHLSQPDNRFLARARAALWEWEQRLHEKRRQSIETIQSEAVDDAQITTGQQGAGQSAGGVN